MFKRTALLLLFIMAVACSGAAIPEPVQQVPLPTVVPETATVPPTATKQPPIVAQIVTATEPTAGQPSEPASTVTPIPTPLPTETTEPAPPLPTNTPLGTPIPPGAPTTCVVKMQGSDECCPIPTGWVPHVVQRGQVWSILAQAVNMQSSALMQSNCRINERIDAGETIGLPFPLPIATNTRIVITPTETDDSPTLTLAPPAPTPTGTSESPTLTVTLLPPSPNVTESPTTVTPETETPTETPTPTDTPMTVTLGPPDGTVIQFVCSSGFDCDKGVAGALFVGRFKGTGPQESWLVFVYPPNSDQPKLQLSATTDSDSIAVVQIPTDATFETGAYSVLAFFGSADLRTGLFTITGKSQSTPSPEPTPTKIPDVVTATPITTPSPTMTETKTPTPPATESPMTPSPEPTPTKTPDVVTATSITTPSPTMTDEPELPTATTETKTPTLATTESPTTPSSEP